MKPLLITILAFFLLIPAACAGEEFVPQTEKLVIETQAGESHVFNVEVARTRVEMVYGLMYRDELPQDSGMLFVFDQTQEQSFWMKNTRIPLDILFIRRDGTIHHIHKDAKPYDLTSIPSNGPVSRVLELNGGTAERLNIQSGDMVRHALFTNKLAE